MREEAQRQINLLLQQQEELAPELYRDLALYLQVLREGLLHAVQQACFHLATQVVPERYNQLPPDRRQAFQQRLQELVQRTSTLLTVEQVMGLAEQQRREHRRQRAQQQRVLEACLNGEGGEAEPSSEESSAPLPAGSGEAATAQGASVHLSLDLPVSADLFDRGLPGLPTPPADPEPPTAASSDPEQPTADQPTSEQELLQSLFQMVAEGLQLGASEDPSEQAPTASDEATTLLAALPDLDTRVTASTLPRDPLLQLRWWTHFDRALRRRLRNLSHAVNVEMLRLGLAQGLLPMNLLDAVLDGQVDALPAPANLLRLPLPLGQVLGPNAPTEVLTLLLRSSDLEYEQPRLRTCRKRLEQRRRALRTMAKRYRSWQRRLSALEAEHQWFQDHAHNLTPAADQS
ncbi:hypothetical protein CB0101_03250 [Synechococcus sp. CB0101]|uniref:hypothetical protein n=1 Tax=Synechococcus sp. CB0101 TaxID=232348 RepID=UPI0002002EC2|nr:hypothetical protein [Synechococcus sp. CB0101]QCH14071.1 hypothetical protein CB0101_03250 [Synechococcus sp. CB0101]